MEKNRGLGLSKEDSWKYFWRSNAGEDSVNAYYASWYLSVSKIIPN